MLLYSQLCLDLIKLVILIMLELKSKRREAHKTFKHHIYLFRYFN